MKAVSRVIAKAHIENAHPDAFFITLCTPIVALEDKHNESFDAPHDLQPEEFFSQGLASSYLRSLCTVLSAHPSAVKTLEVSVETSLSKNADGKLAYHIMVLVCLDELCRSKADSILKKARAICPFMQSLKRNISLSVMLNEL